ncbi:helix-turn-helix transcriptional regulator [Kitasatospora terrestris]|uniref:Helix-turn-helix transcriptional regulator n=1 Tax=Kitasatospora terrestris TaxID=258051 RepID=A0ABP9DA79_9ACTN
MRRTELDPSSSPVAAFGVQLRRSREAKGLSQVRFGRLIGYSDSYLSCIERAERNPTLVLAQRADAALDTGGTLELMYWNISHTALFEGFPEYAQQEAGASVIRIFELGVVPGLLQTHEYAQALEAGAVARGSATRQQADERVAFLLTRQGSVERRPPPLVHAVLDESCVRSAVGGPAVLARQLEHLERLAEQPTFIIQIAPFDLGEGRPFLRPVILLTLRDGTTLGYTETHQRGYLERDIATVTEWDRDYDRLQVEALSQAASLAVIRQARKELSA